MKFANWTRRISLLICLGMFLSFTHQADAQVVPRPSKKGRKYKVRIDSAPQQAAIYLDDEKYGIVGYTPWSGRLQKGNWKVIIKKDGYEATTRVIQVKRTRRTQETFMPMVKTVSPAVLEVRGDADKNAFGAEVWVDGQLQGKIPVTLKLDGGRHLVEIKKASFQPFSQWVTTKEGERVNVTPMLSPLKQNKVGSILVSSDVDGAEIYLDGNIQSGKTPSLLPKIATGPHVVEVRKAPALPWRQVVSVEAGKTIKVSALLKATIGGKGGSVRVLSDVEGAKVLLDGVEKGKVPLDLKSVSAGEHVIEIRAPGFEKREERVTIGVGSALVLKLDLQANSNANGGTIKVVSPIAEAEVFVDGEKLGFVPQQKPVSAGEHFVVVSKKGFRSYEAKLSVVKGKSYTVTAELKAVGALRVLSNPSGSQVMLDGKALGKTPMENEEIASGEHIVTVRLKGYFDYETSVIVEGGKMKVVNASMEQIKTGPSAAEITREQRGLSSFGARTLPRNRSAVDFGIGYPYYFSGGITVGAGKLAGMGFDAGVDLRTYFRRTDLAVKGRLTMYDINPFSAGVFGLVGGGGDLLGTTSRSTWFSDVGGQVSLTGLGAVTITGKAYLNFWTDRHCPAFKGGEFENGTKPIDTCVAYANGSIDPEDKKHIDKVLGGEGKIFKRENGVRLMTAIVMELAIRQRWNAWVMFESGFFQSERGSFIDELYSPMLSNDKRKYFRLGGTYKF